MAFSRTTRRFVFLPTLWFVHRVHIRKVTCAVFSASRRLPTWKLVASKDVILFRIVIIAIVVAKRIEGIDDGRVWATAVESQITVSFGTPLSVRVDRATVV